MVLIICLYFYPVNHLKKIVSKSTLTIRKSQVKFRRYVMRNEFNGVFCVVKWNPKVVGRPAK